MYLSEKICTFYVSQLTGDDTLSGISPKIDGKQNGPFKTLERAVKAVKEYRESGNERPLTISIIDDYFLQTPIDLSGIYRLTIESYAKKSRVIGGIRIENWRRSKFNGKDCFCATVPDTVSANFTDLYIDGKRAHITRYPREGRLRIIDAENRLTKKYTSNDLARFSSKWFKVDPDDLCEIDNIEDALINYDHFWIDEHSPIESYDRQSGTLVMKYNSRFCVSTDYEESPDAAPLYYLTNVSNSFERCGDWYLNRTTRTVYYIPENAQTEPDQMEAFAPVSDKLFIISGEDIRLKNLELTCTKGDYVSTKCYGSYENEKLVNPPLFASDIQSSCCAPGAITFENASRCGIYNCSIHGVGIYGIEILEGCNHTRIESNHIYDTCAGGIRICGASAAEESNRTVSDCIIRNNHIHSCGKRYISGCGILVIDANNCEISDNEIHDLEYSGISVGWVWGYGESATYGCVIKHNHIYDIGKGNISDLGAIYLLGKQRGTIVAENRIHDIKCFFYGAWGIYLDEGSSFVTVENNIIYRTDSECFHLHYGSHNTVRNNVLFGVSGSCIRTSKDEAHDEILFEQNILITDGSPIYGLLVAPQNLNTRRNLLWDLSCESPVIWKSMDGVQYDIDSWRKEFLHDSDSITKNPLFEDLNVFNFTLSDNSPAHAIGFKPISIDIAKSK